MDNQIQIGGALVSLQLEYRNLEGKSFSSLLPLSISLVARTEFERGNRCVLATLTTNAEVLVFDATKDAGKGEWEEVSFSLFSSLLL